MNSIYKIFAMLGEARAYKTGITRLGGAHRTM